METTLKDMNNEILLSIRKALLELGSATIVELSELLGISFPTISKFVTQMEKDGEIEAQGLDQSSGGRRPKRYKYNPEYVLGLAIFLEKSEINHVVFNCFGEVKDIGKTLSTAVDADLSLLTKCIEEVKGNYPKISSIAIGVPGSVNNGRIFHIPGYEELHNFDMKEYLERRFSIPVVIENDMNAAVLGYHKKMGIKGKKSLIYLYSGQNGPGAGIMVNGVVIRGSTNFSGEVSFVPQYDNQNFGRVLENRSEPKRLRMYEDYMIDAISRLIASFVAIINPHTIIFCNDEVEQAILNKIAVRSSKYIPSEHLPELTMSDWKQDYLYGLQSLGLDLVLKVMSK